MKTQDLLIQFLQKAQTGVTVTEDRKYYSTMISRKQRNFLTSLYRKENNQFDNSCEFRFTKIGKFDVSLAKPLYNGSYKLTFENYS